MNLSAFGEDHGLPAPPPDAIALPPVTPRGKRKPAIITPPQLAEDTETLEATLARSLGVRPSPAGTYDPDLFVQSVKRVHDKLAEVRDALDRRQRDLDAREQAVERARMAVEARERKASGLVALAGLTPLTPQRRRFWELFRFGAK